MIRAQLGNCLISAANVAIKKIGYFFLFYLSFLTFSLLSRFQVSNFTGILLRLFGILLSGGILLFVNCGIYGNLVNTVEKRSDKPSSFILNGKRFFLRLTIFSLLGSLFFISMLGILGYINKQLLTSHVDSKYLMTMTSIVISVLPVYVIPSLFYFDTTVAGAFFRALGLIKNNIWLAVSLICIITLSYSVNIFTDQLFIRNLVYAFFHLYAFTAVTCLIKIQDK